jgi:diketogulonate reductase-like aldo/keto reductase
MERRLLGRTGERIPVIGMGTWNMGNAQSGERREGELRALRQGIEIGCSLIDTAESYGNGRSEQLVGEAISGIREQVFLATKVSPSHLRYEDLIEACGRSLQRLGTNYIDLYQVHWPNPSVPIGETMRGMERLVEDGRIRFIGVSNFGASLMQEAREALSKSELASDQVEYSLSLRAAEDEILPFCQREKVTLIAYSPLARGRIETAIPRGLLAKYAMTPSQMMLNWVTHREEVVAIPKSSHTERIEENARSLDRKLSTEDYETISSAFPWS